MERLKTGLNFNESELLRTVTEYGDRIRRNSIIGTLSTNIEVHRHEQTVHASNSDALSQEEYARQDLLKKIRGIEFFSLDETKVKLRQADWLEYVAFEPNV
jgi:hypothetical protein